MKGCDVFNVEVLSMVFRLVDMVCQSLLCWSLAVSELPFVNPGSDILLHLLPEGEKSYSRWF